MKRALAMMIGAALLFSCSNNNGQTGVQNDGTKVGDTNGGLADTTFRTDPAGTDTSKLEHRTDLSTRDTLHNNH